MLGFLGLVTAVRASAQLERYPLAAAQKQEEQSSAPRGPQALHPVNQRGDTWYEFLLEQSTATILITARGWKNRRQLFLDESVRNPYFKYSLVGKGKADSRLVCAP
jgi:hypothetical protein